MRDATRFSRELTNLPAEDIYPESLAERVIEHFKGLAPDAIRAEFIKGEALKDAGWMGIYTGLCQPMRLVCWY